MSELNTAVQQRSGPAIIDMAGKNSDATEESESQEGLFSRSQELGLNCANTGGRGAWTL